MGVVRRIPWQLPTAAILLVLLAALATLQHRWLGEVSEAERERMRARLRTRASAFSQEFDTELTRVFLAFQMDADLLDRDPAAALGDAYDRWHGAASAPAIVSGIYVVSGMAIESAKLQRFDPVHRTLGPAEWPPEFRGLPRSNAAAAAAAGGLAAAVDDGRTR